MEHPVFTFSTQPYPQKSRFEVWREEVNAIFDINIGAPQSAAFNYHLATSYVGSLLMGCGTWQGEGQPVYYDVKRPLQMIRRDGLDHYYLCLSLSHSISGAAGRASLNAGSSQIYVLDLARELDSVIAAGDTIILTIPRDLLSPRLGHKGFHGMVLQGGLGELLGDHMRALRQRLPSFTPEDIPHVQQATLALVAAAMAPGLANLESAEAAIDHNLFNRARQLVEQQLQSPELTPDFLCRRLGISRARLYRLFAQESGVAAYVQLRRLSKAHELLQADLGRQHRVSALAFRFGFKSDAHFSRTFRAAFGYSPTEARDLALAGQQSERPQPVHAQHRTSLHSVLSRMKTG
ncbi:AraC-like DNA-binding protein [Pseudomonas nitritireducens]|uniref:AraC-like DNA-binding protein n=1 Tax=Pseudomonas nitroreducens TaxID=46680 RepID=A0A7W7KMS1_PSENT|nr:helix-turn-helix domain-containing protein [Pseudomonas nitritireducens]MBB4865705.1 AraC-like DNA-binding protein [Pseudomonas nitritireducens]